MPCAIRVRTLKNIIFQNLLVITSQTVKIFSQSLCLFLPKQNIKLFSHRKKYTKRLRAKKISSKKKSAHILCLYSYSRYLLIMSAYSLIKRGWKLTHTVWIVIEDERECTFLWISHKRLCIFGKCNYTLFIFQRINVVKFLSFSVYNFLIKIKSEIYKGNMKLKLTVRFKLQCDMWIK